MKFEEFPSAAIEPLLEEIFELHSLFQDDIDLPQNLALYESSREVIIDLPEGWSNMLSESLEKDTDSTLFASWIQKPSTWHHQLRSEEAVYGYARSIELSSSRRNPKNEQEMESTHELIEIVPSKIADVIHHALIQVENQENDSDSDMIVRVVTVPSISFTGLMKFSASNDKRNPIVSDFEVLELTMIKEIGEWTERKQWLRSLLGRPSTHGGFISE